MGQGFSALAWWHGAGILFGCRGHFRFVLCAVGYSAVSLVHTCCQEHLFPLMTTNSVSGHCQMSPARQKSPPLGTSGVDSSHSQSMELEPSDVKAEREEQVLRDCASRYPNS